MHTQALYCKYSHAEEYKEYHLIARIIGNTDHVIPLSAPSSPYTSYTKPSDLRSSPKHVYCIAI